MARNKSETIPHSHLPEKFHERVRLWVAWLGDGHEFDRKAYEACRATFTGLEVNAYDYLSLSVRDELLHYYRNLRRESDAT